MLIDGYNMILRLENIANNQLNDLEKAREQLISRLEIYRNVKNIDITIVFDGAQIAQSPAQSPKRNIKVLFSPPSTTADGVIKILVRQEANPRDLTVVSSDKDVADFAQISGCLVLSVEDFQIRLNKISDNFTYDDKYDHNLSKQEIDEWLELFKNSK